MLLEKPFAVNEAEMWELVRTARETGCRVMICHVLRYAPFYAQSRKGFCGATSAKSSIYNARNM